MKKPPKYRKQRKNNNSAPIAIGIGLILLGLVLFFSLRKADDASASIPSGDERSVVPMAVDYAAPQLALESLNGKTESLADFRGDVVLLNNWATWCPPCKAEMPSLQKYYEAHEKDGFLIVAVDAGDPKDQVQEFANSLGLTFHIWLDPNGASLSAFRNNSLPNSYVIDRKGTVRYAWTGEISLAMLEKYVTPVIEESN
jgi:peroxiredoxin